MSKDLVRTLIIGLAIYFQDTISRLLVDTGAVPPGLQGVSSAIILLLIYLGADYVLFRRRSFGLFRKRIFHQARFEGLWLETVAIPERPFALAQVIYDATTGRWSYVGTAFSEALEVQAEWQTDSLYFDEEQRRWFFAGEASLLRFDPERQRTIHGSTTSVIALLFLPVAGKRTFRGTIVDTEGPPRAEIFTIMLTRIPRRIIHKVVRRWRVGDFAALTLDEQVKIIRECQNRRLA